MSIDTLLRAVPKFDGTTNPIEWLYKFEAGLELTQIEVSKILPYLLLFFTGDAYVWYSSIMDYYMFDDLDTFREQFLVWFAKPSNQVLDKLGECTWEQYGSFREFLINQGKYFGQLNYLLDDIAKIQWFIRGLPKNWQQYFLYLDFKTFNELAYHAISLDCRSSNSEPPIIEKKKSNVTSSPSETSKPNNDSSFQSPPLKLIPKNGSVKSSERPVSNKTNNLKSPSGAGSEIHSHSHLKSSFSPPALNKNKFSKHERSLSVSVAIKALQVLAFFYPTNSLATISEQCLQRLESKGIVFEVNIPNAKTGLNTNLGFIQLTVSLNNLSLTNNVYILRDQTSDLIFGQDFCQHHSIDLDFSLRRIKFLELSDRPLSAISALLRLGPVT